MNIKQEEFIRRNNEAYENGKLIGKELGKKEAIAELKKDELRTQRTETLQLFQRISEAFSQSMEAQARAVIELTRTINNFNNFPLR